jgi:hypothetical protein
MPNVGKLWTSQEKAQLIAEYSKAPPDISQREFSKKYAKMLDKSPNAVRLQLISLTQSRRPIIYESPYPRYDEPLEMDGDAIVLPDIEAPFHHAEFINRCLELAKAWNIKQCIVAGDLLHFDSLSGWEPNWTNTDSGEVTAQVEAALVEFAKSLGSKQQERLFGIIGELGEKNEKDGMSTELKIARNMLKELEKQFDKIDYVIGNHEGRLLRALQTALDPKELTRLLEVGDKWRVSPFYFSYLNSGGVRWCIEHPKSAAATTAKVLASKYDCSVLMAHSHHFSITTDVSGEHYAAEIGCLVDEARLPYAAQRHTRADAHSLGAAIIKNGYPWILTKFADWESLFKM